MKTRNKGELLLLKLGIQELGGQNQRRTDGRGIFLECKHERDSMARTTDQVELASREQFNNRTGRLSRLLSLDYRKHQLVRYEHEGGDSVDSFWRRW